MQKFETRNPHKFGIILFTILFLSKLVLLIMYCKIGTLTAKQYGHNLSEQITMDGILTLIFLSLAVASWYLFFTWKPKKLAIDEKSLEFENKKKVISLRFSEIESINLNNLNLSTSQALYRLPHSLVVDYPKFLVKLKAGLSGILTPKQSKQFDFKIKDETYRQSAWQLTPARLSYIIIFLLTAIFLLPATLFKIYSFSSIERMGIILTGLFFGGLAELLRYTNFHSKFDLIKLKSRQLPKTVWLIYSSCFLLWLVICMVAALLFG